MLLRHIELYLTPTRSTSTRFGRDCLGDPNFATLTTAKLNDFVRELVDKPAVYRANSKGVRKPRPEGTDAARKRRANANRIMTPQLRGVGVEINIRLGNMAQTPAGHNDDTLELALVNRSFMLIPDPVGSLLEDYAEGGGEFGAMNWPRPDVESALRALAAGVDESRAALLRQQIVRTIHAELPVIPIVHNPRVAAASSRIEGATADPFERSYGLTRIRWRD